MTLQVCCFVKYDSTMKHIFLSIALSGIVLPVCAQTTKAGTGAEGEDTSSGIEFIKTADHKDVKDILKHDRPDEVSAIPVPHFAIRTADNKFVMTIGGQINPIIGTDFGNDLYEVDGAGIGFVTGMIPVPSVNGKRSDFYINPLNANIDFQVVGFGGTKNQVTGYLKFGTNGESTAIKLKKAYVAWMGITAGLKSTLFEDGEAASPPTIDPQGPSGMISTSSYEISYISPSFHGFRFAIGMDIPTYYSSNGVYRGHDFKTWREEEIEGKPVADPEAYNQNIPDIPMWVEYTASDYNRIRFSGIIRNFSYRDMLEGKRRNSVGWGLMLSGNLNPVEPLILYMQAAYGKGIGNYLQDIAGQPLSFIPEDSQPGHMTPSPMMGVSLGATYNIGKKWQVNAVVSESRIWSVGPYAIAAAVSPDNINNYRYGFYAAGNVFYNISSYLQVGMEYLYGRRGTWNAGTAHDNRLQMQFMFTL